MSDEAVPTPGPRPGPVPGPYAEVPALSPTDTTPCWCRRRRPRLLLVREHDRERARRDHPGAHSRPAHGREADDLLLDMLMISVRRLLHARTKAEAAQASAEILTTVRDLTTRRGLPWGRVTEVAFRLRRHHGTYRQAWVIGTDDPPTEADPRRPDAADPVTANPPAPQSLDRTR
ncbi:hypothetical protein [Streptomyces sp. SID3343]|uniref:hypothetical protein n=1 Tax=Streptomyces sp. SID3343 TaxID=2690260 RepID=UPI00136F11C5|nr:hypothetical protein [Streptomyces sp. SID3343]MYW02340.1 hypothetical protein [Streptomyces sp. SID3343]